MDNQLPIEQDILDRLVDVANPKSSEATLGEILQVTSEDLEPDLTSALEQAASDPEIEKDKKKGAMFEEVSADLKILADKGTDKDLRMAKVVTLNKEKNLTVPTDIDYNTDTLQREKLMQAVLVVENNDADGTRWNDVESARSFLEDDLNVSFEEVVVTLDEEVEREKLISGNEDRYRDLFFADFDYDRYDKDESIAKLFKVSLERIQEIINERGVGLTGTDPEDIFNVMQTVYFEHLFGKDVLDGFEHEKQDLDKTVASLRSPDPATRLLAENLLRSQRPGLEAKIKGKPVLVGSKRGWSTIDSRVAGDYLLKYFELKETTTGSDFDLVFKVFGAKYLEADYIGADLNDAISREKNQELLKSIRKVHELAVNLDLTSTKVFENIKQDNVEGIDLGILNMLSLKKEIAGRDVSVIPLVMEEYDGALREIYRSGNVAVNIDSPEVYSMVDSIMAKNIPIEAERKLIMKMSRDLCRITGLDAQFGYSDNKKTIKLESTVRGSFLRGLLCFNDILKGELTDEKQVLATGIDIGAYSFWNKMRGITSRKTDSLYADEIQQIVVDKLSSGETHFANWINGLKKPSEAKKAESDFIETPTLANFVSKLVEAYGYKEGKRAAYLKVRLDACMPYFKRYGEGTSRIISTVSGLFMKDGTFDGKNIFSSAGDLKTYFNVFGIPINTTKAVLDDDSRRITDWLDRTFLGKK